MNQEIMKQEEPFIENKQNVTMNHEDAREIGLWKRLWGVICNPVETLKSVAEQPKILWPFIVVSILNLIAFAITAPKFKEFMMLSFDNMPKQQYTAEQLAAIKASMSSGIAVYSTGAMIVLTPALIWVVYVLIFKFMSFFTGNEAPFKKLYAMAVLTSLPSTLGSFLRGILVATSSAENYDKITTSAALLLPKGTKGALFAFLSNIDPFYIWTMALLAIGAASVLKISTKKAGIVVFFIWCLMAGIAVLFTMLSPQPAGA